MKESIRINRLFLIHLIGFIVYVLMSIIALILINLLMEDENIAVLLYFVIILLAILISSFFKTRLERITNLSYVVKIREHQGEPLHIHHAKTPVGLEKQLENLGYQSFRLSDIHHSYYMLYKDRIKRIFSRYVLELIVIIKSSDNEYYLTETDEDIHRIQMIHLKENKKIDRMLITQIRFLDEMNDEMKEKIKEIVFIRTNVAIVSTINIGLHNPSGYAVMLYGKDYSPSLYYKHHLEAIKKFI